MKQIFKRICYELAMTFSNKESLISAKRIERFISYTIATSILACFACLKLACVECVSSLDATSIILISGTLYGYGAFNTVAGMKESAKQEPNETP
jgi:hypothetical protein